MAWHNHKCVMRRAWVELYCNCGCSRDCLHFFEQLGNRWLSGILALVTAIIIIVIIGDNFANSNAPTHTYIHTHWRRPMIYFVINAHVARLREKPVSVASCSQFLWCFF